MIKIRNSLCSCFLNGTRKWRRTTESNIQRSRLSGLILKRWLEALWQDRLTAVKQVWLEASFRQFFDPRRGFSMASPPSMNIFKIIEIFVSLKTVQPTSYHKKWYYVKLQFLLVTFKYFEIAVRNLSILRWSEKGDLLKTNVLCCMH